MQNLHWKPGHFGRYLKQAENLCKLKQNHQIHTWTNDNEGRKNKIEEKNCKSKQTRETNCWKTGLNAIKIHLTNSSKQMTFHRQPPKAYVHLKHPSHNALKVKAFPYLRRWAKCGFVMH